MVGRGGNSRNWLSPLFMLIHYSIYVNTLQYGKRKSGFKSSL